MIYRLFSVRDLAAENYSPPMTLVNVAVAKRVFCHQMQELSPLPEAQPEFELWELGSFDDSTGEVAFNSPHMLMTDRDVLVQSRSVL